MKKEFKLKSADGQDIHCYQWLPEDTNNIIATFQIIHGMSEHSERYEEFANFLNNNGIAVFSSDHRGHGKTAAKPENLGFFAEKNGWQLVLEDIFNLSNHIKQNFPNLPFVLLGHSMGSLFARAYITFDKIKPNAVLLSGTSGEKGFLIKLGKLIALLQGAIKGKKAKSKLLLGMSFQGFNDKFKPTKTPYDWLSRDEEIVLKYYKDPFCGQIPSNRFFYDMLDLIDFINKPENIKKIDKNIPILIFSGTMDPVGKYGKGVENVFNTYKKYGLNVDLKLYDGGRHEMLNETNRQEVFNDILNWLKEKKVI